MKRFVFVLSLLCLGVGVGKVEAFTLLEGPCSPEMANLCSTSSDPQVLECCKCHKPCMEAAGGSVFDPVFLSCYKNKDKCNGLCVPTPPPSECDTDADCEKDGDACTAPKCNKATVDGMCAPGTAMADGSTKWGATIGKCAVPETPIANCNKDCPKCPPCLPPKIDCDVIGDPKIKSCCEVKGGLLWFVMDSCIPHGPGGKEGCENIAKNIDNSGVFQQCCLINNGVINGDINMCNNLTGGGPGGSTTGGMPTTPEGSASALTCSVAQIGEPVEGKFAITYTVPGSSGPVVSATLTQLSGTQIKVEGEAEPADFGSTVTAPKSMSTKSISDPNNPPSFTVYASTPKSMIGEWKAPFEVKVSLATLDGEAGSALCTESHFLHAEGTGCGCAMAATLTPREQFLAYAVMAALLSLPLVFFRLVRVGSKKKGVFYE